jgi:hypothetical protein
MKITSETLWCDITNSDYNHTKNMIKYILSEFGTKLPCNRFDIGNTIEFEIADLLRTIGYNITELPNSKRIDLCINEEYNLSIKYSSSGDIKLHNSNNTINKDEQFSTTLLLTKSKLYLLDIDILLENNIIVKDFIKNTGDGLKLQRSILKFMEKNKYPFIMDFDINIDKEFCKNRLCSKIFHNYIKTEYNNVSQNK